jgi:hypothetical protein
MLYTIARNWRKEGSISVAEMASEVICTSRALVKHLAPP